MATLGGFTIPAATVSSVPFPLRPDYPYSVAIEPQVYIHTFGPLNAKLEQRFTAGTGQKKYQFRKAALSPAERTAFIGFWIAAGGPLAQFPFARPNSDGTTTTVTCRFALSTLTLDAALGCICSTGITLVEVTDPATAPSYSISATVTRGPVDGSLAGALLGQTQTLIPLVTVTPLAWQTKIWGASPRVSAPTSAGAVSLTVSGTGDDGLILPGTQLVLSDVVYTVGAVSSNTGGTATFAVTPALAANAPGGLAVIPLSTPITVSDRLVIVGGVTYQPRLLDWDGIQQSIGGGADQAGFVFGNADGVFTRIANAVDLRKADVQFALFHVNTLTLINLWRGHLTKYRVSAKAEFPVTCVDGIYELTLPFPPRRISRTCGKPFDRAESGCPWASVSGTGDASSCDKGFATANGCQAHGMDDYFGGITGSPQSVQILDNSTGIVGFGRDRINSTSQIAETVYDQVLPEIYINWLVNNANQSTDTTLESTVLDPADAEKGLPVNAKIIEGRKESEFYAALGIVGEGPLGYPSVTEDVCQYFLDNAPPHGWPKSHNIIRYTDGRAWGVWGLRRGQGHDPVTNYAEDAGSNEFSLSQGGSGPQSYGTVKAAGTAFVEIRRSDTPGVQPSTVESHSMQVPVRYGLPGWTWTSPGARSLTGALNNPVWIAVNAYLKGRGLRFAPAAVQEQYFVVEAAIAAAAQCSAIVPKLLGAGYAKQFKFTGIIQEEKPLRAWMQEILNNCLGYFTFSFGRLVIGLRSNSSAVEAFTAGNILWNSATLDPIETAFNYLKITFADEEFGFAGNAVDVYNEEHAVIQGGLGGGRPQYIKGTLALAGVTTKDQAGRLASVRLCEEVGGITPDQFAAARMATLQTTALALNTQPGMVCSLSVPECPDYPPQQTATTDPAATPAQPNFIEFRVTAWKLNKDYSITISGRTTNWDTYNVLVGPKPSDVVADPVPTLASQAPATWGFRATSRQDGTLALDHFTCSSYGSAVVAGYFDIYYCPEEAQTEMFTPSGFLAADTTLDYGTYGTLPVPGEWLACEGELMLVTDVAPFDAAHGTVTVLRGQAGTTAADHARVTSTFGSPNADWLAEWAVPTGLDIHPGDGLVVGDGFGEEAVVGEYDSVAGLLRTTLPLATASAGATFQTVPVLRRVVKAQRSVTFPPRFFISPANATFKQVFPLTYAGVVAISGTLSNYAGLHSAPVTLHVVSEQLMTSGAGAPAFPYCMRTGGSARFTFVGSAIPAVVDPAVAAAGAFETAQVAEAQSFERAWAGVSLSATAPATAAGPVTIPNPPPDPVPTVPVSGGSITVTHTLSGWESVTLEIGGLRSTWLAEVSLVPASAALSVIAASMADWFNAQPIGAYYSFAASGAVVAVTDISGRGGPMTVTVTSLSPYDGVTAGALALSSLAIAPPLGIYAGRRYAFAFTGSGFRSELSQPTGSSGPTTSASAVSLVNLPVSEDSRVSGVEIYAAEDGQGGGGGAAGTWHLVAAVGLSVSTYSDAMTETALLAAPAFPGATQPAGAGKVLITVTRNGVNWIQLYIPPGASKSNVIHGFGMFAIVPGTALNAVLENGLGEAIALTVVLE